MSKKVLINCKGRFIGDNLSSWLASQKIGATASESEEAEGDDSDNANGPQNFDVETIGLEASRDDILAKALTADVVVWSVCDFTETHKNKGKAKIGQE